MGLRSWFDRRKATTGTSKSAHRMPAKPQEEEPLSPAQAADLKAAWAELTEVVKESAVTGFRACSRGGKPWQEDPAAVRNMATLLRSVSAKNAPTESAPSS